jgi:DNA-directed RNA polymerase III subunit RPC6
MTRSIKSLESRGFIKSIKSVRYPARIYYMLSNLTPSEDVTGGPWFTDGELDTDFVEVLCTQIERYITSRSFVRASSIASAQAKSSRSKSVPKTQSEDAFAQSFTTPKSKSRDKLLQHPPGYQGYPSLSDVMTWLNKSGISEVPLAEEHVRQLMDILYYDRKVERVQAGLAYRSLRQPDQLSVGNGLTEAPCGRCPVFDLCEEGGPVSASNCEYFKEWLDI